MIKLNKHTSFIRLLVIVLVITAINSCVSRENHIISDAEYLNEVENAFEKRKELAQARSDELFGVFNQDLTIAEIEGMKFLYAYMPMNDLADYDGEFFLSHVRASLAARDTFAWGVSIPEDEFRHFVLPYRINNENLDTARMVFFNELKNRIRHLDMLDAAMEVNHWCHEKVTYRGTDIRTSAPLSTVKNAFGRCGEESTFTVAALRSVAIPARQVYTPRWAHSDDNHAWVEFWANGDWHYLGACEPEAVHNYGWFTEPARRAMLIHTKAFGEYRGTERVEEREKQFSLLNTLDGYAQVKEIFVQVNTAGGKPYDGARVEFQLYNYAEFYPISSKNTDGNGLCSFLTGFGDILVWATGGERFDYEKISVAETDTAFLVIDQNPLLERLDVYDLVPPIEREPFPVEFDGREENSKRLKEEDRIRGEYESTFMSEEEAADLAIQLNVDQAELVRFIDKSSGNYTEISGFIKNLPAEHRKAGILLLGQISEKDLRDTKAELLDGHLLHVIEQSDVQAFDHENFLKYILNPRVATEMLVDYREYLYNSFTDEERESFGKDPAGIIDWARENIRINNKENYYETAITPKGVMALKVSDLFSLRIFTVAALRTFGYMARLEPGTGNVQYLLEDKWITSYLGSEKPVGKERGRLKLLNDQQNEVQPRYHIHFTIAKYEMGKYNTLHFDWEKPIADFEEGIELDAGYYMLVTGNRQADGTVLHQQEFFKLNGGESLAKSVSLRKSNKELNVLASIETETVFHTINGSEIKLGDMLSDECSVLAWVDPDKEPSKHAFQDLAVLKKELDAKGMPFVFIIPEDKLTDSFRNSDYSTLPDNHKFIVAKKLDQIKGIEKQVGRSLLDHLPLIVISNTEGDIIYLSVGYKIGIGEEILKTAK